MGHDPGGPRDRRALGTPRSDGRALRRGRPRVPSRSTIAGSAPRAAGARTSSAGPSTSTTSRTGSPPPGGRACRAPCTPTRWAACWPPTTCSTAGRCRTSRCCPRRPSAAASTRSSGQRPRSSRRSHHASRSRTRGIRPRSRGSRCCRRSPIATPCPCRWTTARLGNALFRAMGRVRERLADQGGFPLPVLVVHGGDDTLVPTASSAFLARYPTVERRVYPGVRHEPHHDPLDGERIVHEMVEWLRARLAPEARGPAGDRNGGGRPRPRRSMLRLQRRRPRREWPMAESDGAGRGPRRRGSGPPWTRSSRSARRSRRRRRSVRTPASVTPRTPGARARCSPT